MSDNTPASHQGTTETNTHEMKIIHISLNKVYRYKSLLFEMHPYCGVTFLRHKDHEPKNMERTSLRQWGEFYQWYKLSPEAREAYRY